MAETPNNSHFDARESNKSYLGLDDSQMDRHDAYMKDISSWPNELQKFVKAEVDKVGFSGDVMAVAVADWLKTQ